MRWSILAVVATQMGCAGVYDAPARLQVPEVSGAAVEPHPVTRVDAPASVDLVCARPDSRQPWRAGTEANDCRGPLAPGEWHLHVRYAEAPIRITAPRTRSAVVDLAPPTDGNVALQVGAVAGVGVGIVGASMLLGAGGNAIGLDSRAPVPEQDRVLAIAGAGTLATGAAIAVACNYLSHHVGVGRVRLH